MNDPNERADEHQGNSLKERLWRIIFLSHSGKAKLFDVILMWLIGASIFVIMLESVPKFSGNKVLFQLEWFFTILFTIEYAVRIWVVRHKRRYIFSFFGIVDLLSILPTYVMLLLPGAQGLVIVRILRLLRMFRVLKMVRHMGEANVLWNAFRASLPKITVFMFAVLSIAAILGSVMYVVEGVIAENEDFNSIPQAVYWAIVTISTVGYGDIVPVTAFGKMISTVMMLIGYGIIAVPTGIVSAELNMNLAAIQMDKRECTECGIKGHDPKAFYCKGCGTKL